MENYTEDKLLKRTEVLQSKMSELKTRLAYYQEELAAIEQEHTRRIKAKEGIGGGRIQCVVCRQDVLVGTEQFYKIKKM